MKRKCDCRECGKDFITARSQVYFCSTACRTAFNRRRRDRGAELYDFWMADDKTTLPVLRKSYLDADQAIRAGRKSWQDLREAKFKLPRVFGQLGDKR